MFRLLFGKVSSRMFIKRLDGYSYSTGGSIYNVLMKYLNIDQSMAADIAAHTKAGAYSKFSKTMVAKNCVICKEKEVVLTNPSNILNCLYLSSPVLEHRIYLLQEMGVKTITADDICRIHLIMQLTVEKFKKQFCIPQEQSIVDNLFQSINVSIEPLSLRSDLNDSMTMKVYYETCFHHYKVWNLKLMPEKAKFRHKQLLSFRLSYAVFKFLTNELRFTSSIIEKQTYLLELSLINIKTIVEYFRDMKVAGRDVFQVVHRWPPFLKCDLHNTICLLESFKKFGLADETVHNCREVFNLPYEDFNRRMKAVQENDDLNIWLDHPRILYLIVHYDVVLKRVEVLKEVGLFKYANFHTVTCVRHFFVRMLKGDVRHSWHWKHLTYVLNKELMPSEHLVQSLFVYKNIRYTPIRDLQDTITYLKTRYTKEDIIKSIHIVFYLKSVVEKTLNKLYEEYTPEKGYNFTPSQYLKLCVYTMEKETHFSGDGILLGRETDKYFVGILRSFNVDSVTIRKHRRVRSKY